MVSTSMINFCILRIIDFDEFGNLEYNLSMKSIFFTRYEISMHNLCIDISYLTLCIDRSETEGLHHHRRSS